MPHRSFVLITDHNSRKFTVEGPVPESLVTRWEEIVLNMRTQDRRRKLAMNLIPVSQDIIAAEQALIHNYSLEHGYTCVTFVGDLCH